MLRLFKGSFINTVKMPSINSRMFSNRNIKIISESNYSVRCKVSGVFTYSIVNPSQLTTHHRNPGANQFCNLDYVIYTKCNNCLSAAIEKIRNCDKQINETRLSNYMKNELQKIECYYGITIKPNICVETIPDTPD